MVLIGEKKDVVVHDWIECQNAMKGHNNMFKGFMDDESAYKWLSKITSKQEEHHNEYQRNH